METSTLSAFTTALTILAEKSDNLMIVDAGMSTLSGTQRFAERFPKQHINTGIAEANQIGLAAGLAQTGKIPFAFGMSVFLTGEAYNTIRQSVALSNANVKLIGTHSGIASSPDGAQHQSLEDIALMRTMPNMKVYSPADEYEATALAAHVFEEKGPCFVRLTDIPSKVIYGKQEGLSFQSDKGEILMDGKDLTIFATGTTVAQSLQAAELLREQENIEPRVVNISTIKPIDEELIVRCAKETRLLISVEDHSIIGGLGSAIAEVTSKLHPAKLARIGIKDCFGRSGQRDDLYERFEINAKGIFFQIQEALKKQ